MPKRIFTVIIAALSLFVFVRIAGAEILQKDTKIGDIVYPKGTEVGRYGSGKIAWAHPKRPLKVDGMTASANYNIKFYESGNVESIRLASQTTIDGIKCAANYLVELYDSGKIKMAPLAESVTIQGIRINNRDFVAFSENGKLAMIMIHQPVEIKGKKYYPNCEIYLNGSGSVIETKKLDGNVYYY